MFTLNDNIVDCEWNDWQNGECDQPCGGGFLTNTRTPKVDAQHGGDKCTGSSTVTESCNVHECPGICDIIVRIQTICRYINSNFNSCVNIL